MVDTGDTAWVLISTGLVMLMTPGLAFFYGGLVRKKNMLSVLMQCFAILCVISLQWVLFGYSLAFGPDHGGVIGGVAWVGLRGVGATPCPSYSASVPHLAFMAFEAMFAATPGKRLLGCQVLSESIERRLRRSGNTGINQQADRLPSGATAVDAATEGAGQ